MSVSHSDPTSSPTSAGSSSGFFTSNYAREALADDIGSTLEEQDVTDSDSSTDGGVLLS